VTTTTNGEEGLELKREYLFAEVKTKIQGAK